MDILKSLVSIRSSDGTTNFSITWTGVAATLAGFIIVLANKYFPSLHLDKSVVTTMIFQALMLVGPAAITYGGIRRVGKVVMNRKKEEVVS